MPFMIGGKGAIRRTVKYLESGRIIFRNDVKILSFWFNADGRKYNRFLHESEITEPKKHHEGLYNFTYWHLPQLKYKNSDIQMVTFMNMTPTPFIRAYVDNPEIGHDGWVLVDCFDKTRQEIHDHLKQILGKTDDMLRREKEIAEAVTNNPANFGPEFDRQCMCEIPGQIPCPEMVEFPRHMIGKYSRSNRSD